MTSEVAVQVPTARGRTVIDNRVRQQLIERAALRVPGVVPHRTLVPGRTLPVIAIGGDRGAETVAIQLAASWPVATADVVAAVRTAVADELLTTLAERPDRIDVTITRVESDRTPAQVADAYAAEPAPAPQPGEHRRFAPRRAALASYGGVLFALILIAVGVVAVRDAMTPNDPWIAAALGRLADAHWQWWVWPAAGAVALLGLALLVASVAPRRRTHEYIGDHVWVPRDRVADWPVVGHASQGQDSRGDDR